MNEFLASDNFVLINNGLILDLYERKIALIFAYIPKNYVYIEISLQLLHQSLLL